MRGSYKTLVIEYLAAIMAWRKLCSFDRCNNNLGVGGFEPPIPAVFPVIPVRAVS